MLIGVGLALFALISLSGLLQVAALLVAELIVAITGLGLLPLARVDKSRPAATTEALVRR